MVSNCGDLELRRVAWSHPDAQRLIELVQAEYVERYGDPDETPLEPDYFDLPNGEFFVGYVDGEAVATGAWRRRNDVTVWGTSNAAEIKRMFVARPWRGRGWAREILAYLEERTAAAGSDVLILETGTKQPEAIAMYCSSGYLDIAGFGHYQDDPLSVCLARDLRAHAPQASSQPGIEDAGRSDGPV